MIGVGGANENDATGEALSSRIAAAKRTQDLALMVVRSIVLYLCMVLMEMATLSKHQNPLHKQDKIKKDLQKMM